MGKLIYLLEFVERNRTKLTDKQKKHADSLYLRSMELDLETSKAIDAAIAKKKAK